MPEIPKNPHTTSEHIIRWYASKPAEHRPHMGASIIGHACDRAIWLTWRWALNPDHEGRLLRLFETGRQAESRFVEEIRGIGAQVWDVNPQTGKQWSVSAVNGHFAGSLDGVVKGVPEAPATAAVLECKTHNDKSFKALLSGGVAKSKPQHFDQMQVYMGLMDLERALYVAENKNDSAVYTEWVHFDESRFNWLIDRARRLIEMTGPPPRISLDADNFECKWCNFHAHCHRNVAAQANCRTCCHATPIENSEWRCEVHQGNPPLEAQVKGCGEHILIPGLVPFADPHDGSDGYVVYRHKETGKLFVNGPAGCTDYGPVFSSNELHLCNGTLLDGASELKAIFPGAKVVEGTLAPFDVDDLATHPNDIPVKSEAPAVKDKRKKAARAATAVTGDA